MCIFTKIQFYIQHTCNSPTYSTLYSLIYDECPSVLTGLNVPYRFQAYVPCYGCARICRTSPLLNRLPLTSPVTNEPDEQSVCGCVWLCLIFFKCMSWGPWTPGKAQCPFSTPWNKWFPLGRYSSGTHGLLIPESSQSRRETPLPSPGCRAKNVQEKQGRGEPLQIVGFRGTSGLLSRTL